MKKRNVTAIALSLSLLSGGFNVQASDKVEEFERNICDVTIKDTDYKEAKYLDGGGYYNLGQTYKNIPHMKLEHWSKKQVGAAIDDLFTIFNKENVDVDNLIVDELLYEFINIEMDIDVLGNAFTSRRLEEPSIYLYGTYSGWRSDLESYTLAIHEFAHYIDSQFMRPTDFMQYKEIREIPQDWKNANSPWEQRPMEVFAEDITQIIMENRNYDEVRMPENQGHNYHNRTNMPNLTPNQKNEIWTLVLNAIKKEANNSTNSKHRENENYMNMKSKKNELNIENLRCKADIDDYLKENVDASQLAEWLLSTKGFEGDKSAALNYLKSVEGKKEGINTDSLMANLSKDRELFEKSHIASINSYWDKHVKESPIRMFSGKESNQSYIILNELKVVHPRDYNSDTQQDKISRQEAMRTLYNALGFQSEGNEAVISVKYKDIREGSELAEMADVLSKAGVFSGYKDGTFGVNDVLTREQMVAILNRAYEFEATKKSSYKDESNIAPYAKNAVDALFANGIVVGDEKGYLNPKSPVTKGQFMLMLKRSYLKSGKGQKVQDEEITAYDAIDALYLESRIAKKELTNEVLMKAKLRLVE